MTCTLTTGNLLTLANIITTSGIDHHCPLSLGVFTSVQVTMLYLQENIRQQALASIFGTSQPTISRAINTVLNILDVVLPPPPRPKDLRPWRLCVLDGTLVPCWWWKNARNFVQRETPQSRTQPANTHRSGGWNILHFTTTTRINPWHHSYTTHRFIKPYATLALYCG